ncbi:MAG: ankyrin repeat domain-containing protein, partial [Acidobacteriota bacterium]
MFRRLPILLCVSFFAAGWLLAQPQGDDLEEPVGEEALLPETDPISPREALFLAIELKDAEAARRALRDGGDEEINLGDPSPLATAALHNDLRMVVLLLDFGGNPGATIDSPLEEAIRHENTQMVQLFLESGARVPAGARGQELFQLAQRGSR